jgi:hypothetical protein
MKVRLIVRILVWIKVKTTSNLHAFYADQLWIATFGSNGSSALSLTFCKNVAISSPRLSAAKLE